MSHTPYPLEKPTGWVLYVSHAETVTRLVVFVHGFMGKAIGTWREFPAAGINRRWWQEADLLFVSYESTRDNITAVAHRLRNQLPKFYPIPSEEAMSVCGYEARQHNRRPYSELILLGHSLGGLIVRRALCDAAADWSENETSDRPALLDAKVRLFSPASAGFRAAGMLGLLKATNVWVAVEMFVRRAPAYTDLQQNSPTLEVTRRRTEEYAQKPGFESLRAHIVWANPDNVVLAERYDTDHVDNAWDDTSHSSVCKPAPGTFEAPWDFAETGRAQ